ncbi:MAG: MlaD family protein [Fimbriimonadaceae bacterium]|nr:MlaD family protein [Fimbriimonadaceae bacterium]
MQSAWKVGLFLVLFVVLGLGTYKILGKSMFAPDTVEYEADFDDAGGLSAGSKVVMAGVSIGQVSEVKLAGPRSAIVSLSINKGIEIPTGSVAVLETALIGIGDRQVEIAPPKQLAGTFLKAGDRFKGIKRSALQSILPESDQMLGEINDTLKAVKAVLNDRELKGQVSGAINETKQLIAKTNKMIDSFTTLANRVDGVLAQNQATVKAILSDGLKVVKNIEQTSTQIAKLADAGKLEGKLDTLLANMNKTIENGNALVADMSKFVTDPKLRQSLEEVLANAKTMSESGTKIASNAEKMTENGITLSEKAVEIANKASKLADEASELLNTFKKTIDKLPGAPKTNQIQTRMDVTRDLRPNYFRTDFSASMPIGKQNVHLGLWDAFETNRLNLQLGQPFGDGSEYRYGIYAGRPGVGVDYRIAPGVFLRGDLFGFNEPRLDLRARFDFGKDWTGWLGVDRVFEKNSPSIGIGIRR